MSAKDELIALLKSLTPQEADAINARIFRNEVQHNA